MMVSYVLESPNIVSKKVSQGVAAADIVILCPVCKAMQTVTIIGDIIQPTRKFRQIGDRIYHDCSTDQPCRLYRIT